MTSDDKRPTGSVDSAESEPFLSRWARRKEAVRQAEQDEELIDSAALEADERLPEVVAADAAEDTAQPERILTDEDMPDIETLTPDSDVSGFFSPGVSEALRKKALRKLFHTDRFNIKDGLDDYDDDYTLLQPMGDIVPWDMKRQQERLEERRRLAAEAANDETMDEAAPGDSEITPDTDPEIAPDTPETLTDQSAQEPMDDTALNEAQDAEESDDRA